MLKYENDKAGVNYSTALIGNYSMAWIKKVAPGALGPTRRPFMAYIGPKACHDPFAPAPWYEDTWEDGWPAHAPQPPSYNVSKARLAEHHPTISCRPAFGNQTETCINQNFKDRWRTLLSVDDLIAEVFALTESIGVANETYYIYCKYAQSYTLTHLLCTECIVYDVCHVVVRL